MQSIALPAGQHGHFGAAQRPQPDLLHAQLGELGKKTGGGGLAAAGGNGAPEWRLSLAGCCGQHLAVGRCSVPLYVLLREKGITVNVAAAGWGHAL